MPSPIGIEPCHRPAAGEKVQRATRLETGGRCGEPFAAASDRCGDQSLQPRRLLLDRGTAVADQPVGIGEDS